MIHRDRELLARLALVNRHIGDVVLDLMANQDSGELPADGVRDLGKHLAKIGAELLARAEEIDGNPVQRVIIDAQP